MTTPYTPTPDFVNVFQTTYASAIDGGFSVRGTVKNLVTMQPDPVGISHQIPILGKTKSTTRYGSELPSPNNTYSAPVLLNFETAEASEYLNTIEMQKLNDESFKQIIIKNQAESMVGRYEYIISKCIYDVTPIKSRDWAPSNQLQIVNSLQIMGDGSDAGNATDLVAGDLKPFDEKALIRLSMIKNQMGILNGEMYVVVTPGVINQLLQIDKFINGRYVGPNLPLLEGIQTYNYMGLTIIVAQANMDDKLEANEPYRSYCGLKVNTVGTTDYATCYAFTKEAILCKSNGLNTFSQYYGDRDSLFYRVNSRVGAAVQIPNKVIQIPTTSIYE